MITDFDYTLEGLILKMGLFCGRNGRFDRFILKLGRY